VSELVGVVVHKPVRQNAERAEKEGQPRGKSPKLGSWVTVR